MSMTAHAVGVDCWEEVDTDFNPQTKSKMQDTLGSNIKIIRTKTKVHLLIGLDSTMRQVEIPLKNYIYYIESGTKYYLGTPLNMPTANETGSSEGGIGYYSGSYTPFKLAYILNSDTYFTPDRTKSTNYTRYIGLGYYNGNNMYNDYVHGFHFIHTYCIVSDHSSSGGGGGTSGASVNYIIKAN